MVKIFAGLLHEAVQSVHRSGEGIEILENATNLCSVVQNYSGSHQEVLQWADLVYSVMDSQHEYIVLLLFSVLENTLARCWVGMHLCDTLRCHCITQHHQAFYSLGPQRV